MPEEPTPILLVGSIPLTDSAAVFSTVSETLGTRVHFIPDGETGERTNWINWQKGVMDRTPMLKRARHEAGYGAVQVDLYEVREGFSGERSFASLGYADAAIASYRDFARLQAAGKIAPDTRFQVSLPTPFAPMMSFVAADHFARLEPLYAAAMRHEVDEILAAIPHDKLAFQWDAALEFAILEGVFPAPVTTFEPLVERMALLASWIPAGVPLGYHLCYGDAGHKHFKEPDDCALMVEVMNALTRRVVRQISWFHLPVPIERDDAPYFEPLRALAIHARIYLGLVHARDGTEGALRRALVARRYLPRFGIATECGLGRRPPESVVPLLALHLTIARQLD